MKYTYNGQQIDVQMIMNEKKTSIRLDLGYNLEIRSRFDKIEQVIKEVGAETMNEGFEKALTQQQENRANVYENRKDFKTFALKAFEEVQETTGIKAKLVIKGMSNDYSRVDDTIGTITLNGANEIKSKEFAVEQMTTQIEKLRKN